MSKNEDELIDKLRQIEPKLSIAQIAVILPIVRKNDCEGVVEAILVFYKRQHKYPRYRFNHEYLCIEEVIRNYYGVSDGDNK